MNEDIQNEMEVTQVPNQVSAEATTGKSDKPTDKTVTKKKVNYKKLFIVSLLLVLVWAVIIVAYLMYFKPVDNTNTDNNDSTPLPTVTVLPTIAFELYSDDYLEFEHPAGADVLVEGQRIYHPSGPGKSINGVAYMSITVEERFKLEMYHFLNGGDFAYQTYNPVTMTLTDYITELNPAPEVTQDDIDRYGRLLRYVFLQDGTNINKLMIEDGYAYEYTYSKPYYYQKEFIDAQHFARNGRLGLWSGVCD